MEFQNSQLYKLLDYPRGNPEEGKKRFNLLNSYGVRNLSFVAKGYRGIVLKGELYGKPVAVKLPRSDVPKQNLPEKECAFLKHLDKCLKEKNPAPSPLLCTSDFLVVEWIEGIPLSKAYRVFGKPVILFALESCYLLDSCGVEHSEIKGEKHLIYDGKRVRIIDFESAKFKDKPRNLLQFIGYHILRRKELLEEFGVDKGELLSLIDRYKENPAGVFPKIVALFDK